MQAVSDLPQELLSTTAFNEFLHGLRTRELRRLPADARVIVSGGCAGEWYFEWFHENFPGDIERHYGVELFAQLPTTLPDNVVWLQQSLGSMKGVGSADADLVFGGEVIEHLWPDDIAAFLTESWRVLRQGGHLALDSPNRIVTQQLQWTHHEHTLELSPAEIVDLLGLAGFNNVKLRGVWLCYDRDAHCLLPLEESNDSQPGRADRVRLAESRPDDAFIWWTEAIKGPREPDTDAVAERLRELFEAYRPERLARLLPQASRRWDRELGSLVTSDGSDPRVLFHGPYVPVPPGAWEACFRLSLASGEPGPDAEVAVVDVLETGGPVAARAVTARELAGGAFREFCVPFDAERTRMGVEFRLIASGRAVVESPLHVDLRRRESAAAPAAPPPATRTPSSASLRRRARRATSWPLRRFFDPRFALVHRKAEEVEARLGQRLERLEAAVTEPSSRPSVSRTSELPYNKVLELEDFADPDLAGVIRATHPYQVELHGREFPAGREYRKQWEVAMAARTLLDLGAVHDQAEILGIGAGAEPTIFWLTNHVRRVFATDLYLAPGVWRDFANEGMLTAPGRYWPSVWNPRHLVAQHMDARDLHFDDATFDGIFSSSSIERLGTMGDVERAMHEAHRVLKPGGVLSLATEFRLDGEAPGLPGCLMFSAEEIERHVVGARSWEPVDALHEEVSAATIASARPQEDIVRDVEQLTAERGDVIPHELELSTYPSVAVRFNQHLLTSVHIALRKH